MEWLALAQLIFEIIQFILARRKGERHGLLARLHDAQKCAAESGDCSKLTALRDELKAAG